MITKTLKIIFVTVLFVWTSTLSKADNVDDFLQQLQSSRDQKERIAAAQALGKSKDARAVEPLMIVLNDTDPSIRRSAALALGKIKDARAIQALITILNHDQDSFVREGAAAALRELGQPIHPWTDRVTHPFWCTLCDVGTFIVIVGLILGIIMTWGTFAHGRVNLASGTLGFLIMVLGGVSVWISTVGGAWGIVLFAGLIIVTFAIVVTVLANR